MDEALKAKNEPQKIAKNLTNLIKANNINANQLAQNLGIPMITVRRLVLGKTKDPRISTLKLIADYFNITIDALLKANNQEIIRNSKKAMPQFIPILNWEIIKQAENIKELDLATWQEWQPISLNNRSAISLNSFAIESRPSMHPRFPEGTLFIIDPDIQPADSDIVLVKTNNNEFTLRELIIDPPEWVLHPVVTSSTAFNYSSANHKIIGVNTLTMLYNKRIHG